MEYSVNKVNFLYILIAAAVGFGTSYMIFSQYSPKCTSEKQFALNQAMRKLWSDHVFWTRLYIISAAADSPDIQPTTNRLLKNQEDLGNAVASYYGNDAGKKLTELLKEHILIAADVVTQAKNNNQEKLEEADKKWHKNAEDIATFLSSANPNWPKDDLVNMLNLHLKLTTDEAVARLQKKWSDDIAAFDKVFVQALSMADALTTGIVKQFPDKF
ncbi:MAG: hypothetical protein WA432_05085 [Candidatus Babeliaceae bacterium]